MTVDEVRALVLAFPGVEEGTSYGTPSWRVPKRPLMARLREDGETLALKVPERAEREALLQAGGAFFTTPHYEGSSYLCVRLADADPGELRELLEDVWRATAPRRAVADYDAAS